MAKERSMGSTEDCRQERLPEGAIARLGKGRIDNIKFSPDSTRIAVVSSIGIWVYDVFTGKAYNLFPEGKGDIRFSPDSKILAWGSSKKIIYLWDASTGECLKVLKGHTGAVNSVSFSPDSKTIASASSDKSVRLWDVSTGECLETFKRHRRAVYNVSFSADGKMIASVDNTVVHLWNVSTGEHLATLDHDHYIGYIRFSADGKTVVSVGYPNFHLWDISTGECLTVRDYRASLNSVSFSPDGKMFAIGRRRDTDCFIDLLDTSSGKQLKTLKVPRGRVDSLIFSPDGKMLVSGDGGRDLHVWNISTGKHLGILRTKGDMGVRNRYVSFLPEGRTVAYTGNDGSIHLWDLKMRCYLKIFTGQAGNVSLSPDGKLLVCRSDDGTICLSKIATLDPWKKLKIYVEAMVTNFSPDGKMIACGDSGSTFDLWDVSTGKYLEMLKGSREFYILREIFDKRQRYPEMFKGEILPEIFKEDGSTVSSISFSQDGKRLACGTDDGTLGLWDLSSQKHLRMLKAHTGEVSSLSFAPDGKTIASSGSGDNNVYIWDVSTGESLKTLRCRSSDVNSVSFAPDGRKIACASSTGTVRLWDVLTGKRLKTLNGRRNWGAALSVSFSPDSNKIACGFSDGTTHLWDISTGKGIKTSQGHTRDVNSVSFSSDGKVLFSGNSGGGIRLWEFETGRYLYLEVFIGYKGCVSFLPHDKLLVSSSHKVDKTSTWRNETVYSRLMRPKHLVTVKGYTKTVNKVSFSPDGKTLTSESGNNTAHLWDISTGKNLKTLKDHTSDVRGISISPDGKIRAKAHHKSIRLWGVGTAEDLGTLRGDKDWSFGSDISFSPDSSKIASECSDGAIRLWGIRSRSVLQTLRGNSISEGLHSINFSSDGKTLASFSARTVYLWDVDTGERLRTLSGHKRYINDISFSPDGKTLASGSRGRDSTVRLWDVATGEPLALLNGHLGEVMGISFSPDGKTLASGSADGTTLLWDLSAIGAEKN